MSLALRMFTLALLLGWQAVASGVRKDCCDALERQMPAPALVDASIHGAPLAVPPASPPQGHAFKAPEGGSRLSLARWDAPHAQGPPVFLRIRSLLL